ncbi:MAG: hypothetical protein ACYDHH_07385 [Solirubrobacteraceae bacterium]
MASSNKKKTTMGKLNRERALRERRIDKEMRKQARKLAAIDALENPDGHLLGEDGEPLTDDGELVTGNGELVTDGAEPVEHASREDVLQSSADAA